MVQGSSPVLTSTSSKGYRCLLRGGPGGWRRRRVPFSCLNGSTGPPLPPVVGSRKREEREPLGTLRVSDVERRPGLLLGRPPIRLTKTPTLTPSGNNFVRGQEVTLKIVLT